jgi:centromere protein V
MRDDDGPPAAGQGGRMSMTSLITHRGGCHCGAVAFELDAAARVTVQECNCSICHMTGFLHLIVPQGRFRLLRGADVLETYTFNTGTARHLFCRRCGIKSFYVPRSNPDGYSVNLRCVDRSGFEHVVVEPFDGRNWEQAGASLAHLSREGD